MAVLCVTVVNVIGDLPPGTRRNTYLPPAPTPGYTYSKPPVSFPKPSPTFPTRPSPTFPGPRPGPGPSTGIYPTGPSRPSTGFPTPRPTYPSPRPTYPSPRPDYTGAPSGPDGNAIGPGVSIYYYLMCISKYAEAHKKSVYIIILYSCKVKPMHTHTHR